MNGYILINRGLIESEIWDKPPMYLKVWMYLLIKAQYKGFKTLQRGQLFTSIPEIQAACAHHVGYRKEVPTKDQIWNILDWMRKPCEGGNVAHDGSQTAADTNGEMITTAKTTRGIIVTICNFNVYQDPNRYEANSEDLVADATQPTPQPIRRGKRSQRQADTINEEREEREEKESKKKKDIYGEFRNVKLTDLEIKNLQEKFPLDYQDRIERLSVYIESTGKSYKSHYATLLNWARKDQGEVRTQKKSSNPFLDMLQEMGDMDE